MDVTAAQLYHRGRDGPAVDTSIFTTNIRLTAASPYISDRRREATKRLRPQSGVSAGGLDCEKMASVPPRLPD